MSMISKGFKKQMIDTYYKAQLYDIIDEEEEYEDEDEDEDVDEEGIWTFFNTDYMRIVLLFFKNNRKVKDNKFVYELHHNFFGNIIWFHIAIMTIFSENDFKFFEKKFWKSNIMDSFNYSEKYRKKIAKYSLYSEYLEDIYD